MQVAVISGVTGQTGSYLAEILLKKGYFVIGFSRRVSVDTSGRIKHLLTNPNFQFEEGDICDAHYITSLLTKYRVSEFYNLAAQSHVATSFKQPVVTSKINYEGVLNILNCIKELSPTTKFYQASTSELFGSSYDTYQSIAYTEHGIGSVEKYQDENTKMMPQSPYAVAKLGAHHLVRLYRESYGIYAAAGVLFNHECISSDTPILYKNGKSIHIDCIKDFFVKHVPGDKGVVADDLMVWDQTGWTKIKYASSFQHDTVNDNKGLRRINSRNSVYSVTNDHVCIMDDGESESKNIRVGDRVKLVDYPDIEKENDLDPDFCEMLGMLVGDGHIQESHGQFTNKDLKIRERFSFLWSEYCGESTYYSSKSGFTGDEVGRLDLRNVSKIKDFELYTVLTDVFGHRNKKVPCQVLNSSVDCMEAFLIGYNACDGLKANSCTYNFKNFKTNSATLAAGLLFLVSKVTGQKYNITLEESNKWGKQQFYYSINLLSDREDSTSKYEKVKSLLDQKIPQRQIHRETGISRSFIRKVFNGYVPSNTHYLEKCNNEIKKIIDIPNYEGWFFDLETESGTFAAGVGQGVVHNSPRRGDKFVTKKITKWIGEFSRWMDTQQGFEQGQLRMDDDPNIIYFSPYDKQGFPKLRLGNLDASRDWGHAKDYAEGMHTILQQENPDDFVLCTGETRTIREFLTVAFKHIDIDDWEPFVVTDPEFYRPAEVDYLRGSCKKAQEIFGWAPSYSFEELVKEMVEYEL